MSDTLALCYHAVSDHWPAPLSVTPANLEAQLRRLLRRGYRPATFTDAVAGRGESKVLVVTFDDGYRSVLDVGLPILERLGVPATIFVPTAWMAADQPMRWPGIDQWLGTEHERELMPLTWEQLEQLQDRGWEVGSHTASHPRLTQLSDEALSTELEGSRAACALRLGSCTSIAYPFGDVDTRVVCATRSAGYRAAAALPAGWHRDDAHRWPRVGVYQRDAGWRFATKVSRVTRCVRSHPLAR